MEESKKMQEKRVVITGGCGFIGSFLAEKLLGRGYTVVVLDRKLGSQADIEYVACDVFRHVDMLRRWIRLEDVVVHLACTIIPSTSEENGVHAAEENLIGTLKLLEVCRESRVRKMVFASSGGTVYGSEVKVHREIDETLPINSYGAMKLSTEKYLHVYQHLHDIPYVSARISNPYGRKVLCDEKLGAVDVFLRRSKQGKPLLIWGDGNNVRDFIHIDDVVEFLSLAVENNSVQGIFNVGTGRGTSLNQLVSLVKIVSHQDVEVEYRQSRAVDVRFNVLNVKKAAGVGWRPKYTLPKGMAALYRELLLKEA